MHQFKITLITLFLFLNSLLVLGYDVSSNFKNFAPTKFSSSITSINYYDSANVAINETRDLISQINIGAVNPKFNGSVLVGFKGKVIYAESFGVADKDIQFPNTLDTPTQVASITKTFTGTAVLYLAEKGFLNIDQPVQSYLPEFPYSNITVKHLLSHRSGLPDYLNFSNNYWTQGSPMYNQDVLDQFITHRFKLSFTPDSRHKYSNSNFAILALIIERVTNLKYKDFMNDYVFKPLKMYDSFIYDPAESFRCSYAKSYKANFTDWETNFQDGVYGDKGLFTTPQDLYKWDKALYSEEFVSNETKSSLYEPTNGNATKNYGLGWRIKLYPNGDKYVYHTGWWHGYQGIMSRYIDDEFSVIITSNRYLSGGRISKNAEDIYKAVQPLLKLQSIHS